MKRITLSFLLFTSLLHAEEWNQFRGPGGSGVASESLAPVKLGPDTLAWQVPVPAGLSSPVLQGALLVLTGIEDDRFVTIGYDSVTGKERWRALAPEVPFEKVHSAGSPAASTPYINAERIYVYFGSYGLICYDHQGREQWSKKIPTPKSLYGMSTSPILFEDTLILVLDNEANLPESKLSQSRILALHAATGETAWETPRPVHRSGWSTPTLWKHDQGTDLVVLGNGRVAAYDPQSGAERWYAPGFSRETIAVPVVGKDRVFVAAAMLGGVADEQPDPQPFWDAVMLFDKNEDGQLARDEMTRHFTFPFRPELPPEHPGFGMPMPKDPDKRKGRLDGMFKGVDRNKDGLWGKDEFLARLSFNRGKPRLMAIRPGGEGDVTETHVAWQLHKSIPEVPSPIFFNDRIYLVRNGGFLAAVDADSGELIYRERLDASGSYSASPVVANAHLFLVSERGMVSVVKAGDDYQRVHQFDLGERGLVTPAFDASSIYIRSESKLRAFRR